MRRYGVVLEPTRTGFSAYVPDLPGCVSAGKTRRQTLSLIKGAIRFHIEGMEKDGTPVPEPTSICETVEV
ncbi:MAG: type II toxin-antitoxin system HicB family antitoxin [Planctomycetaceae bacterium]|nr:type II toxin-antitoxin system HicB family antitoxin [Planctomycetota bacterium]NUN51661.1 type II toxin-antitoxin system HicB family antitoxin [Planctomycetaceae bacterium]